MLAEIYKKSAVNLLCKVKIAANFKNSNNEDIVKLIAA